MLHTIRGRNGGIRLARPAEEISLLDVIKHTEDNFSLAECFGDAGTLCPLVNACELNKALHGALDAFFAVLDSYTIADLVQHKNPMRKALGLDSELAASA